jgi:outer membrane protein
MSAIMKILLTICLLSAISISRAQVDTLYLDRQAAIALALENNPNMEIAQLDKARAIARYNEIRGNLMPSLNAVGSYTRNLKKQVIFFPEEMAPLFGGTTALEVGNDNSFVGGLQLAMPIFNPGLNANINAARAEQRIAQEGLRVQALELTWNVQQAWYDVLLAYESLQVLDQSFQLARENLDNIRRLHQQGLVAEYDLISAEVQTENLRPDVLQAYNIYELTLSFLKIMLGLDEQTVVVVQGSLLDSSDEVITGFSIQEAQWTLQQNPTYITLGLQQELLDQQALAVRATGFPSLAAVGSYMYLAESNDLKLGDLNWVNTASAGLQLNIPIFRGRTIRNQVRQVQIGSQQIEIQREYLKENLNIELASVLRNMSIAQEKAEHAARNVDLAKRGYDIARVRYNSGQGTLLEINNSDVALTRARFNLLQAKHEFLLEKIRYDRLLGNK